MFFNMHILCHAYTPVYKNLETLQDLIPDQVTPWRDAFGERTLHLIQIFFFGLKTIS